MAGVGYQGLGISGGVDGQNSKFRTQNLELKTLPSSFTIPYFCRLHHSPSKGFLIG